MTTEKIPSVQDDSAPKDPLPAPPPQKTPSIKPPRTVGELIAHTIIDAMIVGGVTIALVLRLASSEMCFAMYALFGGIRISDLVTVRKSSGGSEPPIAGGLAGALFAMFTTHHS